MKKIVVTAILVALVVLRLTAADEAKRKANYDYNVVQLVESTNKLFHEKTANLEDLYNFNRSLVGLGIPHSAFGITDEEMREVERSCHQSEAQKLYAQMATDGFAPDRYMQLRWEADLANINLTDLFAPGEVYINAKGVLIGNFNVLFYHTGWRQATAEETAKFKALEAKEAEEQRKAEAKRKADLQQCQKDNPPKTYLFGEGRLIELTTFNTYDVQNLNPGHYNILIEDPCQPLLPWLNAESISIHINDSNAFLLETNSNGFVVGIDPNGWMSTDTGYQVPTYIDITPTLSADGLIVVDEHIYPAF